jgi:hypothetical protein
MEGSTVPSTLPARGGIEGTLSAQIMTIISSQREPSHS